LTYGEARSRAKDLAVVTAKREMPPWLPERAAGPYMGERRLTEAEVSTIGEWAAAGAPEGDPQDLPPLPKIGPGWPHGPPDLVLRLGEPYVLPAEGAPTLRVFTLPIHLDKPRWIRAVDLRPSPRHVVLYGILRPDRPGFPDDDAIVWTPTGQPPAAGQGEAVLLEPGTALTLQLYLVPSGKPEPVELELGLYFASRPPARQPVGLTLEVGPFDLPPDIREHVLEESFLLPVPIDVLGLLPEGRALTQRVEVYASLPDHSRRWLLRIARWDPAWRDLYRFVTPVSLPAGATLRVRFTYDNSSSNPRNPYHPPQRIRGGDTAAEETGTVLLRLLPRTEKDRTALERAASQHASSREASRRALEAAPAPAPSPTEDRLDRAAKQYARVLAMAPEDRGARLSLGHVRARQGRLEDAAAAYEALLRLDPGHAEAHHHLGMVRHRQRRTEEAIVHWEKAVRLDPTFPEPHLRLGVQALGKGDLDRAESELRRALELRPEFTDARLALERIEIRRSGAALLKPPPAAIRRAVR
jgi:tetratricopeptide (TPR) repeat protein